MKKYKQLTGLDGLREYSREDPKDLARRLGLTVSYLRGRMTAVKLFLRFIESDVPPMPMNPVAIMPEFLDYIEQEEEELSGSSIRQYAMQVLNLSDIVENLFDNDQRRKERALKIVHKRIELWGEESELQPPLNRRDIKLPAKLQYWELIWRNTGMRRESLLQVDLFSDIRRSSDGRTILILLSRLKTWPDYHSGGMVLGSDIN